MIINHNPRQEFELAIGMGKTLAELSPECIRAIRNGVAFTPPLPSEDIKIERQRIINFIQNGWT